MSFTVSKEDLASIAAASFKCTTAAPADGKGKPVKVIVYKAADGKVTATMNKCVHFGGDFVPDVEDGER